MKTETQPLSAGFSLARLRLARFTICLLNLKTVGEKLESLSNVNENRNEPLSFPGKPGKQTPFASLESLGSKPPLLPWKAWEANPLCFLGNLDQLSLNTQTGKQTPFASLER